MSQVAKKCSGHGHYGHYGSYGPVYANTALKLNFEKLKPTIFLKLSLQSDTSIYTENLKAYANDLLGSKLWQKSTCSVITFHKHIQVFSLG